MDEEVYLLLEKLGSSGKTVIVEGNKDKKALEQFGVKNVVTLKKPLYRIVEDVAANTKDAVILTDLDKKGKLLYGKLNTGLQHNGVRIDNKLRNFLFRKTKIRQIEGLGRYAD